MQTIIIGEVEFRSPRLSADDVWFFARLLLFRDGPDVSTMSAYDAGFVALDVLARDEVTSRIDSIVKRSFVRLPTGAYASLKFDAVAEQTFGPDLTLQYELVWQLLAKYEEMTA